MATELWRWQYELESEMWAAAVLSDGHPVVAGSVRLGLDDDFLAIKLDPLNGNVLWTWKDGTAGGDRMLGAAAAEDRTVILAGYTEGYWAENNQGGSDFAAVKLDASGDVMWYWQEGTTVSESLTSVAVGDDGSVVMGGYSSDDFVMVKLDAHGNKLWIWTGDSGGSDFGNAVGILKIDGSAVLAGSTSGDWDGENAGSADFAAVNVDADGKEVWRWQSGTAGMDTLNAMTLGANGVLFVGGAVDGLTDTGPCSSFAAKLDANHARLWKWQEDSTMKDIVTATAFAKGEILVVAGYSEGSLANANKGDDDFFAAKIHPNSGRRLWLWQDGTDKSDRVQAMAATPDGAIILTGFTAGSFAGNNTLSSLQGVVVMLQMSAILSASSMFSLASNSTNSTSSSTIGDSSSDSSSLSWTILIVVVVVPSVIAGIICICICNWCCFRRMRAVYSSRKPLVFPTMTDQPAMIPAKEVEHSPDARTRNIRGKDNTEGGILPPWNIGNDADVAVRRDERTSVDYIKSSAPGADHLPIFSEISPSLPRSPLAQNVTIPEVSSRSSGGSQEIYRRPFGWKSGPEDRTEESEGDQDMVLAASDATAAFSRTTPLWATALDSDNERASYAPPESSTDTGERPGGRVDSVTTEDHELHKSETSPPVKVPRSGVARAVFDAAQELAQQSTVPGISEAASLLSLLVDLVADHRGNPSAAEGKLRWCRSIVALLNRASGVLGTVDETAIGAERVLLDDVHESIDDLVQLIQTYESRNALAKIITSSLFKRRQDEAEAVIDSAINRLQVGLQLQHGRKLNVVGKNVEAGLQLQQQKSRELAASSVAEALVESRRERRRRKLEQLKIPEDHLTITNELLGKGGFASVFMADYNGRNAGVKVVQVEHDLQGPAGDHGETRMGDRRNYRRRAFMRELEAMTRLRSPHTVHVYGAVTSRSDQLILVMELMSGGDLLRLLRDAKGPLPEDEVRRIVGDVCAGMTFLHEKATIHGDLKSANVLFDGSGRAKIGDFGTSRWAQHMSSTGLATYTTRQNQSGHMSLPWAAPEVMDGDETSYKSDVYSFAIVIWEVLTREVPWAGESRAQQIFVRVVLKGERPRIPEDAPDDLVDAMRACWYSAPKERPSFVSIMKSMKLHGWRER